MKETVQLKKLTESLGRIGEDEGYDEVDQDSNEVYMNIDTLRDSISEYAAQVDLEAVRNDVSHIVNLIDGIIAAKKKGHY